MRTKFLRFCFCFVATPAWASAGLTSAGVDPTANTTPEEPTLAQVAPVQSGTPGTVASAIPGTIAGGAPVAAPAVNGAAGTAVNAAAAGNAANGGTGTTATAAVVTPPPPPDPSTLPVSVIHPLNHAAGDQAAVPGSPNAASAEEPTAPRERRPPAPPTAVPASRPPVSAALTTPANRISMARSEPAPRAAAETPAPDTVDTSSGNYVFYTGSGLAGVILLLSIGSFLRSRSEESGAAPRV